MLFAGLKGDAFRITGAAACLFRAYFNAFRGAFISVCVVCALLNAAADARNCFGIVFHHNKPPFLAALRQIIFAFVRKYCYAIQMIDL